MRTMAGMQYGALSNTDASFRAVCMLLANHPLYAQMPVGRLLEFRDLIDRRQTFCALEDNVLAGLVAWHAVSSEVARRAIAERRWPGGKLAVGDGGGLLLSAFIAPARDEALTFFRRFSAEMRGKILVLQRHYPSRPPRFVWVDRGGKRLGRDL
jgi:hypothetical protein